MTNEENGIEFEKITPEVYKFENVGDSITGVLLEKLENIGANNSRMYALETKTHGFCKIWGSTILDDRMSYIKVGDIVRVTYKGQEKNSKNQDVNLYEVEKGKKKFVEMSPEEVKKKAEKLDLTNTEFVEPTEEEKISG